MNLKKKLENEITAELDLKYLDEQHKQFTQDQLEELDKAHEKLVQAIRDKSFYSELRRIDLWIMKKKKSRDLKKYSWRKT